MSYKALAQDHRQVLSLTVLTLVPCRLRMFALFCGVYGVQRHMGVLYSGAQSSTSRVDGVEQAHCSRLIPCFQRQSKMGTVTLKWLQPRFRSSLEYYRFGRIG